MVNKWVDFTSSFNTAGLLNVDVGEFDWTVVQIVTPTGTVSFNASCDGGYVNGVTDGNATSAINFTAVQAVNLATGASVTTAAASGLFRFQIIGKYLQLSSSGQTVTKLIIYFTKDQ